MPKVATQRVVAVLVLLAPLVASRVAFPVPVNAASCTFVLGFKALHDIPQTVGDCREDEHDVANRDALQMTAGGLLVWRKLGNWTAFTDGNHTWINGPLGLQERRNTQRFSWEKDYPQTLVLTSTGVPSWAALIEPQTGATTRDPEVGWSNPPASTALFQQAGWIGDYHVIWDVARGRLAAPPRLGAT